MAAVMVSQQAKMPWNSTVCDPCSEPGGAGTCIYVYLCFCCAAGDVAQAAGRDYCMTCCVIPFLCGMIYPCILASDRQALVNKYNIADDSGFCQTCCMFTLPFVGACMVCQELNHIKAAQLKGFNPNAAPTVVIVQPQQMMVGQPVMMAPQ